MSPTLDKPVLLLIYRRADVTRKALDAIRAAKPRTLYVSAAGAGNDSEWADCEAARAVIDDVDWHCDVHRNFMQDNRGCRANVASGISWALNREEEVIVIEDDCVATPSFFRFCAELLDRYRDDARVMSISGTNFLFGYDVTPDSYYWSRYPNIWGWATWRRAWQLYDRDLSLWAEARATGALRNVLAELRPRTYWRMVLDFVADGSLDAWDFVWFASCWMHGGLSAQPRTNLVNNVGFDSRATHTKKPNKLARMPIQELEFPLRHPRFLIRNRKADARIEREVYSNLPNLLRLWLYHRARALPRPLKQRLRPLLGRGRGAR